MAVFNPAVPAEGSDLESAPIRSNFLQLAIQHAGSTAPSSPSQGYVWLDTSNGSNHILKVYDQGAWRTLFEHCESSPAGVAISHALVSASHTVLGLTPGHVLTALTATTFGFQSGGGGGEVENTVSTTDATVTTIATIPVPDDTVVFVRAHIVGFCTNVDAGAGYHITGGVFRRGGGPAFLTGVSGPSHETEWQWNATMAVSGNNLLITVAGLAARSINWKSSHITVQVGL